MITILIFDVSSGLQVVHENLVLGVGKDFKEVDKIITGWCDRNGIYPDEVEISGDYLGY